jgi:hypothetical protein
MKYAVEMGARGSVLVKALCYKPEGDAGSIPDDVNF